MAEKSKKINNPFLYPKEKWNLKRRLLTALIVLLGLNVILLPFSYQEIGLSFSQAVSGIVIDIAIILILLPAFNVWLKKNYKIVMSVRIKVLLIIALIIISTYI